MARELIDLAEEAMRGALRWGRCDCATAACSLYAAVHGPDPLAPLRGAYASADEASEVIAAYGGFVAMFRALMAGAGAEEQPEARPGDLALSPAGSAEGPEGRAFLFCIAPGVFASKSRRGMWISHASDLPFGPR